MTHPTEAPKALAPCPNPWCSSHGRKATREAYAPYVKLFIGGYSRVVCPVCPMIGPSNDDPDQAIAAWNTRAVPHDSGAAVREAAARVAELAVVGCEVTTTDALGWPTTAEGWSRHTANYIAAAIRRIALPVEGEDVESRLAELLFKYDPMCGYEDCKRTAQKLAPYIAALHAEPATEKKG